MLFIVRSTNSLRTKLSKMLTLDIVKMVKDGVGAVNESSF